MPNSREMQTVEGLASLLPFVLIAGAFWLLLIRPQRRQQQRMVQLQQSLQVGDEVMLGSGIFGTVAHLHDDRLEVEVSPGVRLQVARAAIVRVDRDEPASDEAITPANDPGEDAGPEAFGTRP